MLDERKVCFIICYNNSQYLQECLFYIEKLNVPKGVSLDTICIAEANSMTEAYNTAMTSCDAKYKIYIHQDVFIYNKDIILDIINLFENSKDVGMIGVIGGSELPEDAIVWNKWDVGATYACNGRGCITLIYNQSQSEGMINVEAIDGMFMATQYDLPWREDLNLKWDFYDVSQSLEFRRAGYKVAVPYQKKPWCMHDCGPSNLSNYDRGRKKCLNEYSDFFHAEFVEIYRSEYDDLQKNIFNRLWQLIVDRKYNKIQPILESMENCVIYNKDLVYLINISEICFLEWEKYNWSPYIGNEVLDWIDYREKYDYLKFLIRHISNMDCEEKSEELFSLINENIVSIEAIYVIATHSIINYDLVLHKIVNI